MLVVLMRVACNSLGASAPPRVVDRSTATQHPMVEIWTLAKGQWPTLSSIIISYKSQYHMYGPVRNSPTAPTTLLIKFGLWIIT